MRPCDSGTTEEDAGDVEEFCSDVLVHEPTMSATTAATSARTSCVLTLEVCLEAGDWVTLFVYDACTG